MSGRLQNKNIIVTAAGQGIGKATAIAFHNEGANVIATDINDKTLSDLNKEYPNIKVIKLDSTDKNAILEFTKKLDTVDVLFNAVGFVHHGTILECEEDAWDFSNIVNVKSMYFMCKAILPLMIKQNRGSIVNVSSCASSLKGFPNRFVYGTTKGAVIGLTKSIALEVAGRGITCNLIAPGFISSPMTDKLTEDQKNNIIKNIPVNRLGNADDVSNGCVYLASDEASFITGTTLHINGGMGMI